ncbi:hypothetical protein NS226_17735 [Aureimonas ureilytica]|uniref:Uncharacterized protein n=1 Tax=Aureimonas ureilytica TaxID=401562 RepID=A0A175R4B2_9HYPH|nr:hypothetical protein [Aureimonas ureilytica]KTQ86967.1 hypothetical protein NS226_17735 [Aureimonas ureilytica]
MDVKPKRLEAQSAGSIAGRLFLTGPTIASKREKGRKKSSESRGGFCRDDAMRGERGFDPVHGTQSGAARLETQGPCPSAIKLSEKTKKPGSKAGLGISDQRRT